MAAREESATPRHASGANRRRNLHVPLPEGLYLALPAEAEQAQRPANALACGAIAQWLDGILGSLTTSQVREVEEGVRIALGMI